MLYAAVRYTIIRIETAVTLYFLINFIVVRNMYLIGFVFLAVLNTVVSHMQPGLKLSDEDCTNSIPPFQSYHIHSLFWTNNADSIAAAENLLGKFMVQYNLTAAENTCKYNPGDLKETDLCVFTTDYEAAGPFLTAQTSVFVPPSMLEDAMGFMVKHKGKLDLLVHPNSGCGIQDHIAHALWAGNKWELDGSIFL